jgi:hypothetical protein
MTIDYEKILRAYIRHVIGHENTDFLYGPWYPEGLNEDELACLLQAHKDVDKEDMS